MVRERVGRRTEARKVTCIAFGHTELIDVALKLAVGVSIGSDEHLVVEGGG